MRRVVHEGQAVVVPVLLVAVPVVLPVLAVLVLVA